MFSFELFEQQARCLQNSVLPSKVEKGLAVEAAALRAVQVCRPQGEVVGIDRFGRVSTSAKILFEKFGFTR